VQEEVICLNNSPLKTKTNQYKK